VTQQAKLSFDALLRDAARLELEDESSLLPALGEVVQDKYRIEQRLGTGGMGVVYRAVNLVNGKQVALKWLRSPSPRANARFLREAYAAAKIDHPNVVNVFDVGMHRGARYLVMELLRGESLGERLRREGPLTSSELCAVLLPVLRGLAAVHAAGLVHRDLKPDNIFLCTVAEGDAAVPKLLDFGISKQVAPPRSGVPLTGEGCALGTLAYMSPEQAAGSVHVDARTDIYALGVLMVEALTGRLPPFVASDASQTAATLAALPPEVPTALAQVVCKALAHSPAERPSGADALARALITSLDAPSEASTLQPVRSVAGQVPVRQPWLFGALGAAAALGILAVLGSAFSPAGVSSARVLPGGALTAPALATPPVAKIPVVLEPAPAETAAPVIAAPLRRTPPTTPRSDAAAPCPRQRVKSRAGKICLADL
jgi:serine/threonine protein kinase